MHTSITGLSKRFHVDGSYIWHIDKRVKRYGASQPPIDPLQRHGSSERCLDTATAA
jgi:hypothetical protein